MNQNSVLDLLSEAIVGNVRFDKMEDGLNIPVAVTQVVACWLEERRVKPEDCIEVWRGSFGSYVQRSFYLYRYYLAAETAISISLLVKDSTIISESHHVVQ